MVLPPEFCDRMKTLLGNGYLDFETALTCGQATKALFCTNKIIPSALCERLPFALEALDYSVGGFLFDHPLPGRHPLHHAGAFYVQDPSAQATVCAFDVRPGMRVLDACAAPGGKTVALACAVGDSGLVVSNEIDRQRARTLIQNVERTGLRNTIVTNVPTQTIGEWYGDYFDLVLADAPCSGEGMFRKYPSALEGWNIGAVRKCAVLQRDILDNVCSCVRPGGHLLYSTCTFSTEENERQIEDFLSRHSDFRLVPTAHAIDGVTVPGAAGAELTRRFYPHIAPGEGQFIALMQRCCGDAYERTPSSAAGQPSREEMQILCDFLRCNTDIDPDSIPIVRAPDGLRTLSTAHPYAGKGVLSYGVLLGTVEKRVFRPHHQFFSAYGNRFVRKLELDSDSPMCVDYIAGRGFTTELDDGWCAVTVDGCALGGGKVVGGMLKNHYPKGLRMA